MKCLILLLSLCFSCSLLRATELPTWDKNLRAKATAEGWILGSELLIDEGREDPCPPEIQQELNKLLATAGDVSSASYPYSPVPAEFLDAYFAAKPNEWIIDPQKALTKTDFQARNTFLQYLSSDSSIDVYTYIFKANQEIPSECRFEELMERHFSNGRPTLVMFYFAGSPELTRLFFSPNLAEHVSPTQQQKILEQTLITANSKKDQASQLEALHIQLSIQIYWIERALGITNSSNPYTTPNYRKKNQQPDTKLDYAQLFQKFTDLTRAYWSITGFSLLGFLILISALLYYRSKRRYYLPNIAPEPRLNAPYGAGIGAILTFQSPNLPPTAQKNLPDYKRL